jgi:hypothetical protein
MEMLNKKLEREYKCRKILPISEGHTLETGNA